MGSSEQSRSQKGESPHGIRARLLGALWYPRAQHPAPVLGGLWGRPGAAGGASEPGLLLSVPRPCSGVLSQSGSLACCRPVLSIRTWLKHAGSFTEGSRATSGFCCGTAVRAPHVARQLPPGSQFLLQREPKCSTVLAYAFVVSILRCSSGSPGLYSTPGCCHCRAECKSY